MQLQVSTPGFNNGDVTWAVDSVPSTSTNTANGTISPSGVYTSLGSTGFHLITATLLANPSVSGSAKVYVTDFPGTLTWRNDNARSGMNSGELALSPGTVNSSKFGKLFSCPLDGHAYAQPLYVPNLAIPGNGTRNVIFVATERDSVFAFDADVSPCVQLWQASLIPPGSQAVPAPSPDFNSNDITPFIGITGTPVISLSSSCLYVVAKTINTAVSPVVYSQILYALDLASGQPRILQNGTLITIPGAAPSPFSALLENQRAALLLENGIVYIAYGSHRMKDSDQGLGDYHGWLFAYDASTLQQPAAFNVTPKGIQGGIWQSGGGPSADSNHNIFVLTGDGPFDANLGGKVYSNSFLRLGMAGTLSVTDYFSPCDEATLGLADFGAGAPLLLPDSAGSSSLPHLMVSASKSGSLYVVNRDNLGGYISGCPDSPSRS